MAADFENWQKILFKCGANIEPDLHVAGIGWKR
jgi:hypothetical protein